MNRYVGALCGAEFQFVGGKLPPILLRFVPCMAFPRLCSSFTANSGNTGKSPNVLPLFGFPVCFLATKCTSLCSRNCLCRTGNSALGRGRGKRCSCQGRKCFGNTKFRQSRKKTILMSQKMDLGEWKGRLRRQWTKYLEHKYIHIVQDVERRKISSDQVLVNAAHNKLFKHLLTSSQPLLEKYPNLVINFRASDHGKDVCDAEGGVLTAATTANLITKKIGEAEIPHATARSSRGVKPSSARLRARQRRGSDIKDCEGRSALTEGGRAKNKNNPPTLPSHIPAWSPESLSAQTLSGLSPTPHFYEGLLCTSHALLQSRRFGRLLRRRRFARFC